MEKNNKKKINGFSKKYGFFAGMVLMATGMAVSVPNQVYAKDLYNVEIDQKVDTTEIENINKYFNCKIPMNKENKITKESNIYKLISFYEGKSEPQNGLYQIEKDPADNLAIAGGITIKYKQKIIDYLNSMYVDGTSNEEILNNVVNLINNGNVIGIPADFIDDIFIEEIQECRDSAIASAEDYFINLSESQIDMFTELNFRAGQEQTGECLKFIAAGNKIEDYTIRIERNMSEEQWNNQDLNIYTEVKEINDGIVTYYAYEKPFKGIDMNISIDNLKNIDIQKYVENTDSCQYDGDRRRCLLRQVVANEDVYNSDLNVSIPIILNNAGDCKYIVDGEEKTSGLIEYLSAVNKSRQQNIENDIIVENVEKESYEEVNSELETIKEEVVEENFESKSDNSNAMVEHNKSKKWWILSSIVGLATSAFMFIKKRVKRNKIKDKDDDIENKDDVIKYENRKKEFREKLTANSVEEKYLKAKKVRMLINAIEDDKESVQSLLEISPKKMNVIIEEANKEIEIYKNKKASSVQNNDEKIKYNKSKIIKCILENKNITNKILMMNQKERMCLKKTANKEILKYKESHKKIKSKDKKNSDDLVINE